MMNNLEAKLKNLLKTSETAINKAQSFLEIDELEQKYFGRKKGELTALLKGIKDIGDSEQLKNIGIFANSIKSDISASLKKKKEEIKQRETNRNELFDISLPGHEPKIGHIHPLRQVQRELIEIFYSMGFIVVEGNELETEDYCFEYLNIPPSHPARDLQDTFFIKDDTRPENNQRVLRTHTSNMQVRMMEQHKPPLRVVVPGRTFRNEATDASHDHTFYQMEGFVVDKNISIANLTYVLKTSMSKILKHNIKIRLRPGYFPYVEPGFEADCSCVSCDGKGCSICKQTGWVEMLGCGMIHPKVFQSAGYSEGEYTGFAFGMGISRLAMMKYTIQDNRSFMGGDLRFNQQF